MPADHEYEHLYRRLAALERDFVLLAARVRDLAGVIEAMQVEDKIAAGVRKALADRSDAQATVTAEKVRETGAPLTLTWPQKVGGLVAGAILILDAVKGLIT